MNRLLLPAFGLACVGLFCGAGTYMPGVPEIESPLGERIPVFFVVPFLAMLLSIAILPLAAGHWWEHNSNKAKVAGLLAVPLAGLLVLHFGAAGWHALLESAHEYVSFIIMLSALFVISGGIYVRGSLAGTPMMNTGMLACGAVLANLIGTTGASLVLVRPLIRANHRRHRVAHILVFFIFIVSNCGGLLTPLGDPPLFLGYLAGVPFEWTLRLIPMWAVTNGLLLVIFHLRDRILLRREREHIPLGEDTPYEPPRISGWHNFLFLLGIVATILASGRGIGNGGDRWPFGIQETLMAVLAAGSYAVTRRELREKNLFSFGPIIEVAVLFAGIFVTMTPALLILNAAGHKLGLQEPWHYFWASGSLSSVLDNAPTYLAMTATACGSLEVPLTDRNLSVFLGLPAASGASQLLAAISCGCVFMGAMTYIGNGPNFMVKAIAESANVRMPGFFGYLAYSVSILIPIFVLVSILFFRR